MAYRAKMNKAQDRKAFSDTAGKSHIFNSLKMNRIMRGGYRL